MNQTIIKVFGINHYNPAAYLWLKAQLIEYAKLSAEPDLYAIEWDSNVFDTIKSQRNLLFQELKIILPDLSLEEIKIVSATMGFEGDAHEGILHPKHIIWLDQKRAVPCSIDSYYKYPISRLLGLLSEGGTINSIKQLIELYKLEYGPRSYNINQPSQNRDKIFAEKIIDYISQNDVAECLTIVGSKHTEPKIDGSFTDRLLKKGLSIEVKLFNPDHHYFDI